MSCSTELVGVLAFGVVALTACSAGEPDALTRYTDPGDGCQQVVSAIGYADSLLVPLGNEPSQKFGDDVRSRLATVSGAIALEVEDFPNDEVLRQAERVAQLADRASENRESPQRLPALREYRREAAQLVIDCADAESR